MRSSEVLIKGMATALGGSAWGGLKEAQVYKWKIQQPRNPTCHGTRRKMRRQMDPRGIRALGRLTDMTRSGALERMLGEYRYAAK